MKSYLILHANWPWSLLLNLDFYLPSSDIKWESVNRPEKKVRKIIQFIGQVLAYTEIDTRASTTKLEEHS